MITVARKRATLLLHELAEDSNGELKAMVAELSGEKQERDGVKDPHWSRRFAASGKDGCAGAPRIRMS